MAQLLFQQINNLWEGKTFSINNATVSFFPMNFYDSISLNTFNIGVAWSTTNSNGTVSASYGLYSLNGSSLSLANSWSRSISRTSGGAASNGFLSATATSATQNITPGTWWIGIHLSVESNTKFSIQGYSGVDPENAFPGGFIGGAMTVSTNAIPVSVATSDLDTTGNDAMFVPTMLISA